MATQYNVFIQWNENTTNYRRFDGGLEQMNKREFTREYADECVREYLVQNFDRMNYDDSTNIVNSNSGEIEIYRNDKLVSCDFGDGTIYVAEVG